MRTCEIPSTPATCWAAHGDHLLQRPVRGRHLLGMRIGHDLSVVAYGDSPITGILEPELTTVKNPGEEHGATSVELLLSMLEDDECLTAVKVPMPLTIRGSTGALASFQ